MELTNIWRAIVSLSPFFSRLRIVRFAAAAGLLGCLLAAAPHGAWAQNQSNYRDPQGRFTLRIPPGWKTAQMNGDAVQFSSGSAYVTLLTLSSSDPDLMLNSIATATGKQWKNLAEVRRGDANFGGRTGKYATYSGINPMGSDSYFELLGVSDGSLTFLMLISAPKVDFTRMKGAFDQIEQSFTLTAPSKAPGGPPPGPAGAVDTAAPPPAPARAARPSSPPPPSTRSASAPAAGNFYRMKLVKIVDERGFERPMTALTLLIPTDWQFQGSVQYDAKTGCHANIVQLVFRASSADGRLAMELLPGNTWQWADDPNMRNMMQTSNQQMARFGWRGCDIMPPMTADQFLRRNVLPSARRGATVAGSETMPDAEARMQEEAREAQRIAAQQGMRVNVRTSASRVRIGYALGGQPVEEWFTAMTTSVGMAGPSLNMRMGRMGQSLYYSSSADHVFGMRAPQGQLDAQEKLFQLLMGTVRVDAAWQARVQQVMANLQAQDSKGAADRSAIIAQAGRDTAKSIHDAYQNATDSREHSMENWSQYMRGVQTFRNPNTGDTVELSNQYGHAWAGADGTYLVTDSANFNPNSSLNGNWTKLEAVQR